MTVKRRAGMASLTKSVDPGRVLSKEATFTINEDLLDKVKKLAVEESYLRTLEAKTPVTVQLNDLVNEALDQYVSKYERKHGEL